MEGETEKFLSVFQLIHYCQDIHLQFRNISLYHCPNGIKINAEIMMNKDVAHRNNIRPGYLGITGLKIIR